MKFQQIIFQCTIFLFLSLFCLNCRLPVCKDEPDALSGSLFSTWNVIRYHKSATHIHHWVNQFLDGLLRYGEYKIEEKGKQLLVINPKPGHAKRCRVNLKDDIKSLKDPKFSERLYTIVKKYKINIKRHRYYPPTRFQDLKGQGGGTQIINCKANFFRARKSYWLAISDKFSKDSWPEACKIGKQLLKWKACFGKKFKKLYDRRTKRNCK